MADYGHDLLFGTFLMPTAEETQHVLELAQLTEQVGLDLVSVPDHPYQPDKLDTWTLLSVIAARTKTVRVLPNVANLQLRPPAMLARSAASLDILSNGRFELGLGTGVFCLVSIAVTATTATENSTWRPYGASQAPLAHVEPAEVVLWGSHGGGGARRPGDAG
jgi:Luciferase-like monooxygenase